MKTWGWNVWRLLRDKPNCLSVSVPSVMRKSSPILLLENISHIPRQIDEPISVILCSRVWLCAVCARTKRTRAQVCVCLRGKTNNAFRVLDIVSLNYEARGSGRKEFMCTFTGSWMPHMRCLNSTEVSETRWLLFSGFDQHWYKTLSSGEIRTHWSGVLDL